jgi:adenylate cyclase
MKGAAYTFEGYTLDLTRGSLRAGEDEIKLRPKCLELLRYLVENPGRLVLKDELIEAVWPNVIVSDDSLAQCISDLRDALNDVRRRIIKTVTRRGYLFAAPVSLSTIHDAAPIPAVASRLSIVVLPFVNLSNDPEQEYFADGITDDLTTDLSRISGSFVIARGTAFTYKGISADAKQVGGELGVRYVLEGSVRRTGDQVRINVQLIDAKSGAHIWANRVDTERADLTEAQDDLVGSIARHLHLELLQDVGRRIERERPEDLNAQDLVMRGRALFNRPYSLSTLQEAQQTFERALQTDPGSNEAKIGIASALLTKIANAWSTTAEQDTERAERLLLQALECNANNPWARATMGLLRRLQDRLSESLIEWETAVALDPNNVTAFRQLGYTLMHLGQPEAAIPIIEKGIRLSPSDAGAPGAFQVLGLCHLLLGNLDLAIELSTKARSGNPRLYYTHLHLAAALALKGDLDKAKATLVDGIRLRPEVASIRQLRSTVPYANPGYMTLLEKTLLKGLRLADMPDK